MIVVGVDVHKHSLTAAAVDELGRVLAEWSGPIDGGVVVWARALGEERLWAVEDCGTSRVGSSRRCSRRVSGWCGCRHG